VGSEVPLWVVLVVGLASPVASFGTAWITVILANKRDLRRLDHERDRQQAELEERRLTDLRDRRREAYRTLAKTTKSVDPTQPYDMTDVAEAISEVEVLTESPAVLEAATSLLGATAQARKVARKSYTAGHQHPERNDFVRNYIRRAGEKRDTFVEAARIELGLPPSPAPLQQARASVRELLAQQNEENAQESSELQAETSRPWWQFWR
jgi:hypothetical protein